jgi:DNA-binding MarR family transcriptional regulator
VSSGVSQPALDELIRRTEAGFRLVLAAGIIFNEQVAERLGLGPSDGQFMTLLQFHGPLTPGQLARYSGLTTGTVTGVIDRLEKSGYAVRSRHPSDRRKVVVSLNQEKIDTESAPLFEGQGRLLMEVISCFSASELDTIARFFELLIADNERVANAPVASGASPS